MANSSQPTFHVNGFGETQRNDAWWVEPLLTVLVLGSFGIYATWRAFQGEFGEAGPYISPFYSPNLKEWFPAIFGSWPLSPAVLILWAPLGFRATCYYYRKAYYRAFFQDPPACAVGEPNNYVNPLSILTGRGKKYTGETKFPLILQNAHRFFFYVAAIFMAILWYDAIIAFNFNGSFGIGLGSVIMLVNVILLSLYTFSCHSWRHLLGGNIDCFSCAVMGDQRRKLWERQSVLNEHHMLWAWLSLFSVALTDLYIFLNASGVISDLRIV